MYQHVQLCFVCSIKFIASMSSCTLHSIHIIFCHIHTDQRSTVVSGSQQHITVTTSSPTLIPLSSAGHSLLKWLDHSSSTLMHSQLRIHVMLCYTHTDQQSILLSGSQVHCIYNELHTTVPTTSLQYPLLHPHCPSL